jgi:hypothetical protein
MQGFGLTQKEIVELLSVYASAEQQIAAVATSPGWNVLGAFTMPATATVRVDVIGSVSDGSLVCRTRLYCITAGAVGEVSGSIAQLSATQDTQVFSGNCDLLGQRTYQFQAEVTGNVGDAYFGGVRRATLEGQA